jgi:hypothetical protein
MNREELSQKLQQIYGSEELERIQGVVSEIPERVLGLLHGIEKEDDAPLGQNGIPAKGEYKKESKTVILYENVFCPKVLFHEIGHCIYHECPEMTGITNCEYENDLLSLLETTGLGLSWETGAAEFCANAYQLYKTGTISTEEDPNRFRSLAEKLGEKRI